MSLKSGRVGVNPRFVDPVDGSIVVPAPDNVYTKTECDDKFLSKTDASSTYLAKTSADGWTTGVQTLDGETFEFDNLNDSYGYDLFGDNKLYGITSLVKASGTDPGTIKLTYTVTGASIGDYAYLRILK